jgi:hypothetical protein
MVAKVPDAAARVPWLPAGAMHESKLPLTHSSNYIGMGPM